MKKICYAVAASLDGCIAGPKGEADAIIVDPEMDFESARSGDRSEAELIDKTRKDLITDS